MVRALIIALLFSLFGAPVMAKDDKVRQHPGDPQLDPHIFENLSMGPAFTTTGQPRSALNERIRQQVEDAERRAREEMNRDPAPIPRERPPHIKPEWEAKLPEWEAMVRKGEVPKDPDFMAYMSERRKQLHQDPAYLRMIEQKAEELRARINELRSGVPEDAL